MTVIPRDSVGLHSTKLGQPGSTRRCIRVIQEFQQCLRLVSAERAHNRQLRGDDEGALFGLSELGACYELNLYPINGFEELLLAKFYCSNSLWFMPTRERQIQFFAAQIYYDLRDDLSN